MKYYRLIVSFVILIAFAGQMLLGDGTRSYITQTGETIGSCVNRDFQNKSKIELNTSQTADVSCTTSFNILFISQQFFWELVEVKHTRKINVFYQYILEQLYVDKLLEPPQTLSRLFV